MSQVSTKPPSGMRDFLPADLATRRHVMRTIESVYENYGFQPLETPSLENIDVLTGKYGEEGDQLLYRVMKRRDALARALEQSNPGPAELSDLGLRYDLTVPLARVIAQYRNELPKFFRRYQIQPVWRADRPGKGRFREFFQCDVDILGAQPPLAELEVCAATCSALDALGFTNYSIALNHRALLSALIAHAGLPAAKEADALIALDKLDKIGADGVRKEFHDRGVSAETCDALLQLVSGDGNSALSQLKGALADNPTATEALDLLENLIQLSENTPAKGRLVFTPTLARGLGYYTGPIFEVVSSDFKGSLGGGGRYDNLVGMFGKQSVPAVGFSLGVERIMMLLSERELSSTPRALLCWTGVDLSTMLATASKLREQSIHLDVFPQPAKLGKQLDYANSAGFSHALIFGEDEAKAGAITAKNLKTGEQAQVPFAQLVLE